MSKTQACQDALTSAKEKIKFGSTWTHYKGGIYRVIGHIIDTDDGQVRIHYYRVGGPEFDKVAESGVTFVRKLDEFLGENEDGVARFQRQD